MRPRAGCAYCVHFQNSAALLEQRLAGLSSLASAHASVRNRDGLCVEHDRYLAATSACARFRAATGGSGQRRARLS